MAVEREGTWWKGLTRAARSHENDLVYSVHLRMGGLRDGVRWMLDGPKRQVGTYLGNSE